jgi:hypothetical protein
VDWPQLRTFAPSKGTKSLDDNRITLLLKERKKKMKKIVLTLVAMLTMTMANAENEDNNTVEATNAYDMRVNMRKLAVTLGLTLDQMEAVQDIHHQFCNEMMLAAQAEGDERTNMVEQAVKKDVRYMHYILDDKQYRKYLLLLNTTLYNRGLR